MIRLGRGTADFAEFAERNLYYVDRTNYIEILENLSATYNIFLRPRRFGKSLWISTLKYYYGIQYKDRFTELFGKYYIGKNPTPYANQYLILQFNFSGIDTENKTMLKEAFYSSVKNSVSIFLNTYTTIFTENEKESILAQKSAETIINTLFSVLRKSTTKVYLLIDEYDHFTNELLSFNFRLFKDVVTKNGWVRKFYEVFKNAANDGVIARMFITGISPVTIDSMTSGFNITTSFTNDIRMHNLLGFTKSEVEILFKAIEIQENHIKKSLSIAKEWYDGYLFTERVEERLYNPNMVLYFMHKYLEKNEIPTKLLDINIASDYTKIANVFKIGNQEEQYYDTLNKLLNKEPVPIELTESYSFERDFNTSDLLSLLFYMGFLTIQDYKRSKYILTIPNRVIHQLYYDYFIHIISRKSSTLKDVTILSNHLDTFIYENDLIPLANLLAQTIKELSVRDKRSIDEKHIQAIFFAFLNLVKCYNTKSEYESNGQYYDIFMQKNDLADSEVIYDFLLEFKYVKKAGDIALETLDKQTVKQVKRYLKHEEIKKYPNLRAWRIIIVKDEVKVCREVEYEVID